MKLLLSLLTIVGLATSAYGQEVATTGDSLYYLRPVDTMTVYNDLMSGQVLFDHYVAAGQTLFGIAKFYGLSLDEVYHLNPKLRIGYKKGDKARMAIPYTALRATPAPDSLAWFVPVYYQMRKGETLYGLTNRILKITDDRIERLNPGLDPARMSAKELIAVGYLKLDGISADLQAEVEDPYVRRNRGLRERWENTTKGKKLITENGKAAWTRKGDRNKWMALHRTAPIGTIIEIEDPRSRKTIYARVVARIPDQVTDRNVVVIVSPLLVKAFGVRDKHFYVRTRHF